MFWAGKIICGAQSKVTVCVCVMGAHLADHVMDATPDQQQEQHYANKNSPTLLRGQHELAKEQLRGGGALQVLSAASLSCTQQETPQHGSGGSRAA